MKVNVDSEMVTLSGASPVEADLSWNATIEKKVKKVLHIKRCTNVHTLHYPKIFLSLIF